MAGESTLAALARQVAGDLERAGLPPDTSRSDAEVLLRHILALDRAAWLMRLREPAPAGTLDRVAPLVSRRQRREPVAYITGQKEFYGRTFDVTPDVLIPRPETELVVSEALQAIARCRSEGRQPVRAAEIGTGSGCLAVTLALEANDVSVVATDVSAPALRVAVANAERLGAMARVDFRHVALLGGAINHFDLVMSNPPYVAEQDRATLMPDVRDYEPAVALFGGADGLDVIRMLLPAAARALTPGGWIVMEIGTGQAEAVRGLLQGTGLDRARVVADLAGHERVVVAEKPH